MMPTPFSAPAGVKDILGDKYGSVVVKEASYETTDATIDSQIASLQAAGADVLYAPGLASRDDIAAVVSSVDRPVNVVMGLQGVQLSLADLSAMGVRRVSVGSALSRAALGAFLRAVREMLDHGTFAFASEAASYAEINAMFETPRV